MDLGEKLRDSAQNGDEDTVRNLLDEGVPVDAVDQPGRTALYIAVREGHESIVNLLIERGADVNKGDRDGLFPLHMAALEGYDKLATILLDQGAEVDSKTYANQWTSLHRAARQGHVGMVRVLLRYGAQINFPTKAQGWIALHWAIDEGHTEVMKVLLVGGSNINFLDNESKTPIDIAHKKKNKNVIDLLTFGGTEEGRLKIADQLFQYHTAECNAGFEVDQESIMKWLFWLKTHGADINVSDKTGENGVHKTCRAGNCQLIQWFLQQGADFYSPDPNGHSPLQVACQSQHGHLIDTMLLNRIIMSDEDVVFTNNSNGQGMGHLLGSGGYQGGLKEAIRRGISLTAKDKYGRTVLHLATMSGHKEATQILLAQSIDPNISDEKECSALHFAAAKGHTEILKMLLAHGARIDQVDYSGYSPLHFSSASGFLEATGVLLSMNGDVKAKDKVDQTPLHKAASNGHTEVFQKLVDNGATIQALDKNGCNCLHLAAQGGHFNMVKMLLDDFGLSIDLSDYRGCTALHLASCFGQAIVVELLISYKAALTFTNNEGKSPLDLAAEGQHVETVTLLLNQLAPLQDAARRGDLRILERWIALGGNVNSKDQNNTAALHQCCETGQYQFMQRLLEIHNIDINLQDGIEETPLHKAVASGHLQIIEALLQRSAEVNTLNHQQETPLHLAMVLPDTLPGDAISKLLLDRGANPNAMNQNQQSCLHLAVLSGRSDLTDYLLTHKADVEVTDVNLDRPIHLASRLGLVGIVRKLIASNAQVYVRNMDQMTPLDLAKKGKYLEVIEELEEKLSRIHISPEEKSCLLLDENLIQSYEKSKWSKNISIWPLEDMHKVPRVGLVEEKEEVLQINMAIEELINGITEIMKLKTSEETHLKLKDSIMVGSNADGTKTRDPDEFDFLLMFYDTTKCLDPKSCPNAPGYVNLHYENVAAMDKFQHQEYNQLLSSSRFHEWTWNELSSILRDNEYDLLKSNGCLSLQSNVDHGFQNGKASNTLMLRWDGIQYRNLEISVDLVPMVVIPTSYEFIPGPVKVENLFVLPKPPHPNSPLGKQIPPDERAALWRVTFADTTYRNMKSLDEIIRKTYLTSKVVRALVPPLKDVKTGKIYRVDKFITSFMLKTLILTEAEKLKRSHQSLQENVLQAYIWLQHHLEKDHLPTYWKWKDASGKVQELDILAGSKRDVKQRHLVTVLMVHIIKKLILHHDRIKQSSQTGVLMTWSQIADIPELLNQEQQPSNSPRSRFQHFKQTVCDFFRKCVK